jgi:hypothetical protein
MEVSVVRARACIKCKEYIVIHPNNPINQTQINVFEKSHHLHTLITVNLDEVKDSYKSFKNNGYTNPIDQVNDNSESPDQTNEI